MAFNNSITPGSPPLLWSNIYDAFTQVNENFDILVATIGDGSGLTPLDFEALRSNVSPNEDNRYNLGSTTHQWKKLHVSEYLDTDEDRENGLWLGTAFIKGQGNLVDLPANSTIDGSLIIDPSKTFFKFVDIDGSSTITANTQGSTVGLVSGTGIQLTADELAGTVEFANTGILDIVNGDGITVSTVSGESTITNSGVRSLQSTTSIPLGRVAGAGININGSTGDNLKITNTGVLSISQGVGITVYTDPASGDVSITNSAPAVNSFAQIQVNGDTANKLQADAVSDILNINSGQGITLTKNTGTDTLTITVDPQFDLKGSIFGDDSTKIVDAVENKVYATGGFFGNLTGGSVSATTLRTSEYDVKLGGESGTNWAAGSGNVAIGYRAGYSQDGSQTGTETTAVGSYAGWNQKNKATAIGSNAGTESQGEETVGVGFNAGGYRQLDLAVAVGGGAGYGDQGGGATAIGFQAGHLNQGSLSVAIGKYAGHTNQTSGSIVINASGVALNGAAAGLYIDPLRNQAGTSGIVQYNSTTKEVSYSTTLGSVSGTFTGNIFTNLIDSSDSSQIVVTPLMRFESDIVVENDITVAESLTVKGSRVINLAELKTVIAASTDFADFKTRIAAL